MAAAAAGARDDFSGLCRVGTCSSSGGHGHPDLSPCTILVDYVCLGFKIGELRRPGSTAPAGASGLRRRRGDREGPRVAAAESVAAARRAVLGAAGPGRCSPLGRLASPWQCSAPTAGRWSAVEALSGEWRCCPRLKRAPDRLRWRDRALADGQPHQVEHLLRPSTTCPARASLKLLSRRRRCPPVSWAASHWRSSPTSQSCNWNPLPSLRLNSQPRAHGPACSAMGALPIHEVERRAPAPRGSVYNHAPAARVLQAQETAPLCGRAPGRRCRRGRAPPDDAG